jgi:hypothetical protein
LNPYTIEQSGAVTSLYFDCFGGWEQKFLYLSDVHFDSIFCNRELLTEHLDQAVRDGAMIFVFGDLYDAMQGRFDPRRSNKELRPEYRRDDYYDFVVNDLAEFWEPYARNTVLLCKGNHETSVLKNANTDLMDRLAMMLNLTYGTSVKAGGYGGWVRMMLNMSDGNSTGPRRSIKVKYFHGTGGEAPITRGVIHTSRQAVYLPDADVVVNGHNHHNYYIPISRERISNKGVQFFDIQHHIRIPGYKMSYADGSGGWEVERGGVPKPIGCVWMTTTIRNGIPELRFENDIRGGVPCLPVDPGGGAEYAGQFADDTEYA